MSPKRLHILQFITLAAVFGMAWLLVLPFDRNAAARAPRVSHHVYVAFGFHGNLYHSFRNNTNDEQGFGKDIRVIRHTIATLDLLNKEAVPVKAVWDFDNLFSLQEILPQYAPDIIEDIRRRIRDNGDEAILMSYNNGLVSAMNERELNDAMRWAITNPWHSGVKDVFGTYSPIVRPHEMMTTPGDFSIYKRLGIQAVALYYSATPFDAFRVFSRPLTRDEAHNPILYRNPGTGEEMAIIPSYHIGDLVEHVSLRNWVEDLHRLQDQGTIKHDALILINFDADSDFWSGIDLPWALQWLPNTRGLDALVRGIKDLPYVRFTTLTAYLQNHPPVGTFYFSQDTADGSFDGYNSWSEKARVSPEWTSIERSRRMASAAGRAMALLRHPPELADIPDLTATAELIRLRALSTTHFGMATPFVAPQREQAARDLIALLDQYSDDIETRITAGLRDYLRHQTPPPVDGDRFQWLDSFVLLRPSAANASDGRFLRVKIAGGPPARGAYLLAAPDGRRLDAIGYTAESDGHGEQWLRLYVPGDETLEDGVYHLYRTKHPAAMNPPPQESLRSDSRTLSNGILEVRFDPAGGVEGIYLNGVRQAGAGSLMPYVHYGGKTLTIRNLQEKRRHSTGSGSVTARLSGILPGLPAGWRSDGKADYTVSLLADRPYLLLSGAITYPASDCTDIIKAGAPTLSRRADLRWRETAPAEIRFAPRGSRQNPPQVLKRNYLGVESRYTLDYFRFSPKNLNLDDVNNHITQSYVGIVSGGYGMAVAMDTTVQANFAFAPLKMTYDAATNSFQVRANPFGTYFGRQYRPPTWGNGQGYEMTLYAGEQLSSAAPTYNGASQKFDLLISFFKGDHMPAQLKTDLLAYSHPPTVISLHPGTSPAGIPQKKPLNTPTGFGASFHDGAVYFFWDTADDTRSHYRIYCGNRPGQYERIFPATGHGLRVTEFAPGRPFAAHRRYYARIEAISANGRKSVPTGEISFKNQPAADLRRPRIPLGLEFRVLWSSVRALLHDILL
jgi:hypothetical protein